MTIAFGSLDAEDPVLLGKFPASGATPTNFRGVDVDAGNVFTVTYGFFDGNGAVRRIEGTSPPTQSGASAEFSGARKVEVDNGHAHVLWSYSSAGNWRWGLRIFDVATLQEFDTDNRIFSIGAQARGLTLVGTTAYVAREGGLTIIDVSDPDVEPGDPNSGPRVLGTASGVTDGYDVDVLGNTAYVADGSAGLKMFDIANPTSASPAGTWSPGPGKSVRGVKIVEELGGQVAYLVGNGFWIVEVTNPAAPVQLAFLEEEAERVEVANGFAYVAGDYGLRVYALNDLDNPSIEGRYITGNQSEDVRIIAPYVYLADRSGFYVLQHGPPPNQNLAVSLVSNPTSGSPPLDVLIDATATGGSGPHTYTWFVDGFLAQESQDFSLHWTFETADVHLVRVRVRDGSGASGTAQFSVDVRGARARLYGTVKDVDPGGPIANATVVLYAKEGKSAGARTVNPAGEYEFSGLAPGIYRLVATAPDHEARGRLVSLRPGNNLMVDFHLPEPLTAEQFARKLALIDRLKAFPESQRNWGTTPVAHPYAEAEALAEAWLESQENFSEALQRLTLAEGAFEVMADHATIYANWAAEYTATLMANTLDLVLSLSQLEEYLGSKFYYLDLHGGLIDGIASSANKKLAAWLGTHLGGELSEAVKQAFEEALKFGVEKLNDQLDFNLNQYVFDWKARFANALAARFLELYTTETEPILRFALERAMVGPPYDENYTDSNSAVLLELRSSATQSEIVVRAQNNIDIASDTVFGTGITILGALNSILGKIDPKSPVGSLGTITEQMTRLDQLYGNYVNIDLALSRLWSKQPQHAANAVFAAFGEIAPPTFGLDDAIPAPAPTPSPRGAAQLPLPLPSAAAAKAALNSARSALLIGDLAAFALAMDLTAIPESNAFLHAAGIFATMLGSRLDPGAASFGSVRDANDWGDGQLRITMALGLEVILGDAAGADPVDPDRIALRDATRRQIDSLLVSLDLVEESLAKGATEASDASIGAVLAVTRFWAGDRPESLPKLPAPGQPLGLHAEITNVGDFASTDALLMLSPGEGSTLVLEGGETSALPPINPGATTTVSWILTYEGTATGRFEFLKAELAHANPADPRFATAENGWLFLGAPYFLDGDHDRMGDAWEVAHALDPGNPSDASGDLDQDGLTALEEFLRGTDPTRADSDGDGASDGAEFAAGTNPNDPKEFPPVPPRESELCLEVRDFAGLPRLSLVGRILKTTPPDPIAVQRSLNLVSWAPYAEITSPPSFDDPKLFSQSDFDTFGEWIFIDPEEAPEPQAFFRLRFP